MIVTGLANGVIRSAACHSLERATTRLARVPCVLRALARARPGSPPTVPQRNTAVPALPVHDDRSYFGAFRRKRSTVAIGAATLVFLTVTVHDLPAQAATIKTEAFTAASQTLVATGPTFAPPAGRDDVYTMIEFTPVQWPIPPSSEVSSGFGMRIAPCWGCSSDHQGVDFDPGYGTPIHAIADGVVVQSSIDGGLGQHVVIQHTINGKMVQSVYGHMIFGSQTVNVGDKVKRGQVIGDVGSTGASTGPHLHFEIRPGGGNAVEPLAWLAKNVTEDWKS
jgi:murein DD-endopeptidase MepM/ murein hydrolase activator NlpD